MASGGFGGGTAPTPGRTAPSFGGSKPGGLGGATSVSSAVMSLGGFNGTDPALTLAQFEKLVQAGQIHYFVADAQGFIGSTAANTSTAYAIQQWVEQHYTATTVGGSTVYDLSG
jgi:hypothetical protein